MKIDRFIATEVLGWREYEGSWFDIDECYKEELDNFFPSYNLEDAFYVLERLGIYWIVEREYDAKTFNCLLYYDEGEIREKHPVDTIYSGTAKIIPLAICRAVLNKYKAI